MSSSPNLYEESSHQYHMWLDIDGNQSLCRCTIYKREGYNIVDQSDRLPVMEAIAEVQSLLIEHQIDINGVYVRLAYMDKGDDTCVVIDDLKDVDQVMFALLSA